jgi:PAS domain S-box-containing protein
MVSSGNNRKLSLTVRLIIWIIGFSSFVAVFTTATQLYIDYRDDIDHIDREFSYIEFVNLPPITESLWILSDDVVQLQIDSLVKRPEIHFVSIEVDDTLSFSAGDRPIGDVLSSTYDLIFNDGDFARKLGEIEIVTGLSDVYQRVVEKAVVIFGVNVLKSMVVAVFMFVLFHFYLTRKLTALASYTRGINFENLSVPFRFAGGRSDEFDDIAQAVNQMQHSLRESYDDVRSSKESYEDLYDSAPDMYFSVDTKTTSVTRCNQTMAKHLGLAKEEIIGRKYLSFFVPGSQASAKETIQAFVETGVVETDELIVYGKNGTEISVSVRATGVAGAEGKYDQCQVVWRDISVRREAEENLRVALIDAERANQAKSEFLATMSHELRTPLNAILGFSEMISAQFFGKLGSHKYLEYADDIHTSSEHLLQLINDVLDLSAIEAGKQEMQMVELDFGEFVDDFASLILEGGKRKGLEISIEIAPDLPPIVCDRRAMKQILLNIFSNAVKFTPAGGHISLVASADENWHRFVITDDGKGIDRDKIAELYEPFVQAETDPYLAREGTGLGLAIVNSLIELHDGEINIDSVPDEGTTVTLKLPRRIGG